MVRDLFLSCLFTKHRIISIHIEVLNVKDKVKLYKNVLFRRRFSS